MKNHTVIHAKDDIHARRSRFIRVLLDDGDYIETKINGTMLEIADYYFSPGWARKVIAIEFLK